MDEDYWVVVCSRCHCASCWHGEFLCEEARDADVRQLPASKLRQLGHEHPHHFSKANIRRVTGADPEPVERRALPTERQPYEAPAIVHTEDL